jgi:hypothetical protein
LIHSVVADAQHEKVANIPDVEVIAVPVSPEDVREGAEFGEFGRVGGLAVAVPGGGYGMNGGFEEEAVGGPDGGV